MNKTPQKSIVTVTFKDFFDRFSFLYGCFLNSLYKSLSPKLGNIFDLNFNLQVDKRALIKKLNNFHPIRRFRMRNFSYAEEPFIHIYQSCVVNYPHISSTGKSFYSEFDAITKAFFEALERYSYRDFFPVNFIEDSVTNIKKDSLDVFSLAGFSKDQKDRNERLQVNEDSRFKFFKGECLTEVRRKFVPLQLISQKYFRKTANIGRTARFNMKSLEPLLRWPVTTGVAAGLSKEEVIYAGMLEIVERDAFMVTYLNKVPCSHINLEKTNITVNNRHICDHFKNYGLEIYAVRLLSDVPLHSIATFIIDRKKSGPALSMGASAHHSINEAILKAASEALTSRLYNKARYLDSMSLDIFQGKLTKKERKIFWSKQENLSKIDFMLKQPEETSTPKYEIESLTKRERMEYLLHFFKEKNYMVHYANITPPFLKECGIEVGKVIIPEMQPMHLNEAFPCIGGSRLWDVPLSLGYKLASELNKIPHPFH